MIRTVATNYITNADRVIDSLDFQVTPAFEERLRSDSSSDTITSIRSMIVQYLQGNGAPCQGVLNSVREFKPDLTAEQVREAGYRAKMFYRAATGSDRIMTGQRITVSFFSILRLWSFVTKLFRFRSWFAIRRTKAMITASLVRSFTRLE